MNSFASIVDIKEMPTTDELYEAALFVEDAAAVANILVGVSMSEGDKDRVLAFFSRSLSIAGEVLAFGLDPNNGILSSLAEIKEVS